LDDLLRVLEVEDPESAIIFCNTKDETKRVAAALDKRGLARNGSMRIWRNPIAKK